MTVYLLQHSYGYGKEMEFDEVKVLGIYSSEKRAKMAIEQYNKLPGFKEYPNECFYIDSYELDHGEWLEGFETT